jgi:hypothetical protein
MSAIAGIQATAVTPVTSNSKGDSNITLEKTAHYYSGTQATAARSHNENISNSSRDGRNMTDVNSRRETRNSRNAIKSRDANKSASISDSRDANSTEWTPATHEFSRIFAKKSSEQRKICKKDTKRSKKYPFH